MRWIRAFSLVLTVALGACAARPIPINPISAAPTPQAAPPLRAPADGDALALAFSGGGARAAAFSLGVMLEMREMQDADGAPLLNRVGLVSGVSGGAIAAAYFGLRGPEHVDGLRADYLDKDWDARLHTSPLWPANWWRALDGGLNNETLLADWLDEEVFDGAGMHALWDGQGPQVWINAVDIYNGVVFPFTPERFDALCSDLSGVRAADAVAASMAVPIAFRPVLIEPRRQACPPLPAWTQANEDAPAQVQAAARAMRSYRDGEALPYLHLVDGGVIDNLGLQSLSLMRQTATTPYAPFAPQDAARLRRFTLIAVNAESVRYPDWQGAPSGPSGAQMLDTIYDIAVEAGNRASFDAFRDVAGQWRRDLIAWRCGLSASEAARLRGDDDADWRCDDVTIQVEMIAFDDLDAEAKRALGLTPTRVTLPAENIDALIEGGREAARRSAALAALRAH